MLILNNCECCEECCKCCKQCCECVSENVELMPLHLVVLLLIFTFIAFVLLGCFLEYIERI